MVVIGRDRALSNSPSSCKICEHGHHVFRYIPVVKVVVLSWINAGHVDVRVIDEGESKYVLQFFSMTHPCTKETNDLRYIKPMDMGGISISRK